MGADRPFRPRIAGVIDEDVHTNPEKTVFVRVAVTWDRSTPHARPSGGQDSNVLSALASADALAVIPVGTGDVTAGCMLGELHATLMNTESPGFNQLKSTRSSVRWTASSSCSRVTLGCNPRKTLPSSVAVSRVFVWTPAHPTARGLSVKLGRQATERW